jgi:preprotein translocase subunit SecD
VGGFALRIQFDHRGTILLEEYTTANRGRMVAIFSQFGDELKDYRWLAAPVISRPITDGVLIFTPDTNREEAEEIATGLNNVSKKVHAWVDQ